MNQVDISFARTADFEHVYEPDADSWLLIDSLTAEVQSGAIGRPTVALEIGCGSGAVITHLALQLNAHGQQDQRQQKTQVSSLPSNSSLTSCAYFATDINPRAVRLAARTAAHNRVPHIEFVQTAFVDALLPRLARAVDVLVFNPPYVPTPPEEMNGCGIERAWAGGARGREVLDVLLPQISVRGHERLLLQRLWFIRLLLWILSCMRRALRRRFCRRAASFI